VAQSVATAPDPGQALRRSAPVILTALTFVALFWQPMATLLRDWWTDPDAGHGLLLFPVALYLGWRRGVRHDAGPMPLAGLAILTSAVVLRYLSGLAAELFTMRVSLFMGVAALIVFVYGTKQLVHWWLPLALLVLSIPLPAVVIGTLALPLQFKASEFGAALLEWRHVPVLLEGNVIRLPGQSLFVTEACSGLRSLTALLALGLLIGGVWLRSPAFRVLLVALTIPVAMLVNGIRVFLTGFFVYYVDPRLAEGFMHYTEGWALFVMAFLVLGVAAWLLARIENRGAAPEALA